MRDLDKKTYFLRKYIFNDSSLDCTLQTKSDCSFHGHIYPQKHNAAQNLLQKLSQNDTYG